MRQVTYAKRNWRDLFLIVVLGVMIGSGAGVATKMLAPVVIWAKGSPVETAKFKRKTLLPSGSSL